MALLLAAVLCQSDLEWRDGATLEAALREAADTGSAVVLYFSATW